MLDMKFIREHAEEVKENLVNRHNPFDLDHVLDLDQKRRELLQQAEVLKSQKNAASKMIAQAKKEGRDASKDIEDMREVGKKISAIDSELASIEAELRNCCFIFLIWPISLFLWAKMILKIRKSDAGEKSRPLISLLKPIMN